MSNTLRSLGRHLWAVARPAGLPRAARCLLVAAALGSAALAGEQEEDEEEAPSKDEQVSLAWAIVQELRDQLFSTQLRQQEAREAGKAEEVERYTETLAILERRLKEARLKVTALIGQKPTREKQAAEVRDFFSRLEERVRIVGANAETSRKAGKKEEENRSRRALAFWSARVAELKFEAGVLGGQVTRAALEAEVKRAEEEAGKAEAALAAGEASKFGDGTEEAKAGRRAELRQAAEAAGAGLTDARKKLAALLAIEKDDGF